MPNKSEDKFEKYLDAFKVGISYTALSVGWFHAGKLYSDILEKKEIIAKGNLEEIIVNSLCIFFGTIGIYLSEDN